MLSGFELYPRWVPLVKHRSFFSSLNSREGRNSVSNECQWSKIRALMWREYVWLLYGGKNSERCRYDSHANEWLNASEHLVCWYSRLSSLLAAKDVSQKGRRGQRVGLTVWRPRVRVLLALTNWLPASCSWVEWFLTSLFLIWIISFKLFEWRACTWAQRRIEKWPPFCYLGRSAIHRICY